MTETVVVEYLKRIEDELYGLDGRTKASILTELEGHIREKAFDEANKQRLDRPTNEIYLNVTFGMGEPEDIAKEYMKVSMRERSMAGRSIPTRSNGTKMMIYLTGAVLLISGLILIAVNQQRPPEYTITEHPYAGWGIILVIISVFIIGYGKWMYVVDSAD
jgi:uncharacterized membrane protein